MRHPILILCTATAFAAAADPLSVPHDDNPTPTAAKSAKCSTKPGRPRPNMKETTALFP